MSPGSGSRRSVISAHMNGCEIVFSKPIGSGLSSYARWASGSGTKRCRGMRNMAVNIRSSSAALPSSSSSRSTCMPMSSTICRHKIARCFSFIGFMSSVLGYGIIHATPISEIMRTARAWRTRSAIHSWAVRPWGDRRLPRAALALSVAGWNNALVLLAPELSKDLPPVARDRDWESHLRHRVAKVHAYSATVVLGGRERNLGWPPVPGELVHRLRDRGAGPRLGRRPSDRWDRPQDERSSCGRTRREAAPASRSPPTSHRHAVQRADVKVGGMQARIMRTADSRRMFRPVAQLLNTAPQPMAGVKSARLGVACRGTSTPIRSRFTTLNTMPARKAGA